MGQFDLPVGDGSLHSGKQHRPGPISRSRRCRGHDPDAKAICPARSCSCQKASSESGCSKSDTGAQHDIKCLADRLRAGDRQQRSAPFPQSAETHEDRQGHPIGTDIVYAIGDVHGRADLLADILEWIDRHAAVAGKEPSVHFLGDIVDRGPDSRAALDLVADTLAHWPSSRLILGNHDDWMLQFLAGTADEEVYGNWLSQGGAATLASYGVDPQQPQAARESLLARHPRHAAMLCEASILVRRTGFAFVHAGIEPSRPLDAQERAMCLKIRSPFLNHVGPLEKVVVHGHSPQRPARPTVTENRISMDTGAFFTGVLSVVAIDEDAGSLAFAATDGLNGVAPIEPTRLDRGLGAVCDPTARP